MVIDLVTSLVGLLAALAGLAGTVRAVSELTATGRLRARLQKDAALRERLADGEARRLLTVAVERNAVELAARELAVVPSRERSKLMALGYLVVSLTSMAVFGFLFVERTQQWAAVAAMSVLAVLSWVWLRVSWGDAGRRLRARRDHVLEHGVELDPAVVEPWDGALLTRLVSRQRVGSRTEPGYAADTPDGG